MDCGQVLKLKRGCSNELWTGAPTETWVHKRTVEQVLNKQKQKTTNPDAAQIRSTVLSAERMERLSAAFTV
jgi:hypothetical protein